MPNKVENVVGSAGREYLFFHCPACNCKHNVIVRKEGCKGGWVFNNNLEEPTIRPSIRVTGGEDNIHCHSLVTYGRIYYYPDSKHKYRQQTLIIPNVSNGSKTKSK